MRLFHFSCDHGRERIGVRGEVVPQIEHPLLHIKVSWFTSDPWPDRESTGLGMHLTQCDRMAYRYVVRGGDEAWCVRWLDSDERQHAPAEAVKDLESYGDVANWWIATGPIRVRLA